MRAVRVNFTRNVGATKSNNKLNKAEIICKAAELGDGSYLETTFHISHIIILHSFNDYIMMIMGI